MKTIGMYIQSTRVALGLTQPEVIDAVASRAAVSPAQSRFSLSQSRLSRLENGSACRPTVEELVAILEALHVAETEWPEVMRLPVVADEQLVEAA